MEKKITMEKLVEGLNNISDLDFSFKLAEDSGLEKDNLFFKFNPDKDLEFLSFLKGKFGKNVVSTSKGISIFTEDIDIEKLQEEIYDFFGFDVVEIDEEKDFSVGDLYNPKWRNRDWAVEYINFIRENKELKHEDLSQNKKDISMPVINVLGLTEEEKINFEAAMGLLKAKVSFEDENVQIFLPSTNAFNSPKDLRKEIDLNDCVILDQDRIPHYEWAFNEGKFSHSEEEREAYKKMEEMKEGKKQLKNVISEMDDDPEKVNKLLNLLRGNGFIKD